MDIIKILAYLFASIVVSIILSKAMMRERIYTKIKLNLLIATIVNFVLIIKFGIGMESLCGSILFFVLLYASYSDITRHEVDDYNWIMILLLGVVKISCDTSVIINAIIGACCCFVVQIISAIISKNCLGGADIKISIAAAFLLGFPKGIYAMVLSLVLSIICIAIYRKAIGRKINSAYPLVPFLSIGTMLAYII